MNKSHGKMTRQRPQSVDRGLLKQWPLPMPPPGGDKEARRKTLIIAGMKGMSGAAVLAGTAALRAGAGVQGCRGAGAQGRR